jgi:hypothetical protein
MAGLWLRSWCVVIRQGYENLFCLSAHVKEVVGYQLTKAGLIDGYRRLVDFDTHHVFTSHDLADWPGAVLLIMADDDPGTPEPVRAAMRALYLQAGVHMFSGTGHAASVLSGMNTSRRSSSSLGESSHSSA